MPTAALFWPGTTKENALRLVFLTSDRLVLSPSCCLCSRCVCLCQQIAALDSDTRALGDFSTFHVCMCVRVKTRRRRNCLYQSSQSGKKSPYRQSGRVPARQQIQSCCYIHLVSE
eukprot:TRINITY_DN63955_c0_g1_i1.p1 TRINITY_DN63955_c0_g1~~TRINITY_DN63955_c0_g1_i1.p1  ORF type:complete len:115 (-),score=8.28 TRINITY_DN63955_c0_g1_i1:307-651(-)